MNPCQHCPYISLTTYLLYSVLFQCSRVCPSPLQTEPPVQRDRTLFFSHCLETSSLESTWRNRRQKIPIGQGPPCCPDQSLKGIYVPKQVFNIVSFPAFNILMENLLPISIQWFINSSKVKLECDLFDLGEKRVEMTPIKCILCVKATVKTWSGLVLKITIWKRYMKPSLKWGNQSSEVFSNLSDVKLRLKTKNLYLFWYLLFLNRCFFSLWDLAFIKGNVCICKFPALIDQVIIYSLLTFAEFSAHIYISLICPREGSEMFWWHVRDF